jgi:hypothetical protein
MLILYRYIWLVYVYFGLSADFDYPRQFSPPLPRIIEILLYVELVTLHFGLRWHLLPQWSYKEVSEENLEW